MKISISYIGKDKRYAENLKEEFSILYDAYTVVFNNQILGEDFDYRKTYQEILDNLPNIIYIDFSTNIEDLQLLSKILISFNFEKTKIIGLYPQIDPNNSREKLMYTNLESGLLVNIIKSGSDLIQPIYLGMRLALPDYLKNPKFYELKDKDGIDNIIYDIGKVNYIDREHIECETNLTIGEDEEVDVDFKIPADIVESGKYKCLKHENQNLYFRRSFKTYLYPFFIDPIFVKDGLSKLELMKIDDDIERREQLVEEKHKPEFDNWVLEMAKESKPKVVKIGMVDHNLVIYKEFSELLEEDIFSYRIWGSANRNIDEIIKYKADIVVFQLENVVTRDDVNSEKILEHLVKTFKANEYEPYFVVFGAKQPTEELQNVLEYNKVISYPSDLSIDMIKNLAKIYENKKKELIEEAYSCRYIPDKSLDISNLLIGHKMKVFHITEYTIDFEVHKQLAENSFFKLTEPCEMIVTVLPQKENSPYYKQKDMYHGILHTMTNQDQKKLRQFLQQQKK